MGQHTDTQTIAGIEHGLDSVESAIAELRSTDAAASHADRLVGY